MNSDIKKKRRAYWRGQIGEWVAILYLLLRGYTIVKRRYKTPVGEIDIVARKRDLLIAIEVKTRKTIVEAGFSITFHQERRIERALMFYLAGKEPCPVRFDLILIAPWRRPYHIVNAWA